MKKLLSIIILTAAICTYASARDIVIIDSDNLHCSDTCLVYTPEYFNSQREVPAVFLLHGWSGCYADWSNHMDLQELADRTGFRIICPDGFYDSWYVNDANPDNMQWLTFFEKELYPAMNEHFGLDPDKTFITGLSMGGHGAMSIFLRYPQWFRSGGSMSGVLDLTYSSGSRFRLVEILGAEEVGDAKFSAASAINLLDNIAGTDKFCIVTCGLGDKTFYPASVNFAEKCKEKGINCISMYSPGKHSWAYWTFVVWDHLDWFKKIMNGENLGF